MRHETIALVLRIIGTLLIADAIGTLIWASWMYRNNIRLINKYIPNTSGWRIVKSATAASRPSLIVLNPLHWIKTYRLYSNK